MVNLGKYLPFRTSDKYVLHHLDHFTRCVDNGLFPSAFYHLHILYMCFVYFQLTRIAKEKQEEFQLCWIGFPYEEKDFLKNSDYAFAFSRISEKTVFRFFRLVKFDDGLIGQASRLIKKRNNRMHADGNIFFETEDEFQSEYNSYIKEMEKIVIKQKKFLSEIYNKIIYDFGHDYDIVSDDLENEFSKPYYFSIYELNLLSKNDNASAAIKEEMENYD